MFKNKSYIGISFVILVFGIYAVPKIVDRIQSNGIVQGDRLDKVSGSTAVDEKLVKIGAAPKFELTNQDNVKITNDFYKGKVYVLEFFFATCPSIFPKMNANKIFVRPGGKSRLKFDKRFVIGKIFSLTTAPVT